MVYRVPEDLPCWIFFLFFFVYARFASMWHSFYYCENHIIFCLSIFFFFLFLHWYTYKRIFNCEDLNGWPKDFFFAPQNVFSDCSLCFIYIIYKNIYVCFCTNKTYYMYLYISKWYIYLNKFLRASYA